MGKYSKNLSGQKLKVFVSNPIEYTDDTTFAAFIANAPEGEIGVFNASGTVRTTLLTATDEFFIAQKRDGVINKTPNILFGDLFRKKYQAYDAPVKKVQTIGYNGTSGDLGFNFTGASQTNKLTFQISVRETTPGNQPFPVQEGYAVVTTSTADEYTVLASIVSQLNGDYDLQRTQPDRFVKAEITSNGALTAFGQTLAVVNGSTSATAGANVTFAAGTKLSLAGSIYNLAVAVTAGTAIVLDRPYQGDTATLASGTSSTTAATMAYTSGTNLLGVRLTGLEFESHFLTASFTGLSNDTVTTITDWKLGAGSGTSIRGLEEEAIIFDGVGSTVNAAFRADYGYPTLFSSLTKNYNQFFLEFAPKILPSAALPIYEQKQIERIVIAAPTDATTPSNELQTIFGL